MKTWLWTSNAALRFAHLPVLTVAGHKCLWCTDTDAPPDIPFTDIRLVAAVIVDP